MNSVQIDKQKQIGDIVSTVKLASLLFTGIILFKYIFTGDTSQIGYQSLYYEMISILLPLLILLFIYFVWTFSTKNKLSSKYDNIVNKGETFLFILLFSIIIYISGANESNYKFLFLFIIITTTIQSGMKHGMITAIISSIIILSMDLVMMPASEVNIYFENARYGGEEFAVILEDTTERETLEIAERIRANVEETYFDGEENQPKGKITASIGISVFPDKAKDELELIKSADDALYRAKFFNKNRVETYTSILDDLKKNIDDKDIELVTSIKTLISIINAKDRYTYSHVERVVIYSRLLADKLKLSEIDKSNLIYGAYMHDIGKINIPKEILVKRMKLEKEEWEELKQHPDNGVEIIKSVESLKDVIPLIKHHHERYDGKGYPNGLSGEEIPYLARVLTVVDSFDAMTSNRPYNRRKSYEEGIEELRKCSGAQFDPEIAKAFIEVIESNAAFL